MGHVVTGRGSHPSQAHTGTLLAVIIPARSTLGMVVVHRRTTAAKESLRLSSVDCSVVGADVRKSGTEKASVIRVA